MPMSKCAIGIGMLAAFGQGNDVVKRTRFLLTRLRTYMAHTSRALIYPGIIDHFKHVSAFASCIGACFQGSRSFWITQVTCSPSSRIAGIATFSCFTLLKCPRPLPDCFPMRLSIFPGLLQAFFPVLVVIPRLPGQILLSVSQAIRFDRSFRTRLADRVDPVRLGAIDVEVFVRLLNQTGTASTHCGLLVEVLR